MYELFLQSQASKDLIKLQKKAKIRHENVSKTLSLMAERPFLESVKLKDDVFHGLRRARAGDDRIIFLICEECRNEVLLSEDDKCIDCSDIPENGIKIFNILPRKHAYRRK